MNNSTTKHNYLPLLAAICAVFFFPGKIHAQSFALINAKLYPSANAKALDNAVVVVEDGRIKAVGQKRSIKIPGGYQIIDARGKVVMPAFWNSHVHFIEPKWENADVQTRDSLESHLRQMLTSYGFVYAFDLAELNFTNVNHVRNRIRSGELKGPTILSVGVPFTSRSPFYIRPATLPEIKTVADAEAHIDQQFQQGANGIKIWSASPVRPGIAYMSDSLIQTASRLTRAHHAPLFAHPTDNAGVLKAVQNGVTVLTHTSPDDGHGWDTSLINLLISKKVALIPTIKLFDWELKRMGVDPSGHPLLETASSQLSAFFKAGGTVLFGTDVGYMSDYDPSDEYTFMSAAGMSFRDILASLTINPSAKFGFNNTGEIAPGMDADIVVLNDDPADDVKNFSNVVYSIHKGKIVYQKTAGSSDLE